jgi:hypothetical protein
MGTLRRVAKEVSVLIVLAIYFLSDWSIQIPSWLEISILGLIGAYILGGLLLYPKARKVAEGFYVYLMDDALGFPVRGHTKTIPYGDLRIKKVKIKNGQIRTIYLSSVFHGTIKLQGLESMNELYERLARQLEGETQSS